MKIRTLGRHVREGVKNLGRNGWMTFASVSAVTITLMILGVFFLLAVNVEHITKTVENQVEISVSLDVRADQAAIDEVRRQLEAMPQVQSITFISKQEGLEQLRESFKENANLLDGLEQENPLPDKFVVKAKQPQDTAVLAGQIKALNHVEKVIYGEEYIGKLFAITKTIRNIGVVFIIGLAFTAMFLIANTIKLTIVARRREIEIMKLVGATNWFIRWPFFVEGFVMGVTGALIPVFLLSVSYYYVSEMVSITPIVPILPMFPLVYQIALILISIGAFIGIWGSLVSVRRFLRI